MNWGIDWNVWGVPLVILGFGLLALLVFIVYIWCLVSAAKNGKWVWFVLMIFFPLLAILYPPFAGKRPPRHPAGRAPIRREPYL